MTAEADLLAALAAAADRLGSVPPPRAPNGAGGWTRTADAVPERPGHVTVGWTAGLEVEAADAALAAVAAGWCEAGWRVTSTPVGVVAERDGLTASLVLDAAGRTARLSGGTPPLPA